MRKIPDLKQTIIDHPGWQLMENVELTRKKATQSLDEETRVKHGQFFTSNIIARQMAGMAEVRKEEIRVLDPGAGVGILSAALVERIASHEEPPEFIHVEAYEIDKTLLPYLESTLDECQAFCKIEGIEFNYNIQHKDYIEAASIVQQPIYDMVIMNPPYGKINRSSSERKAIERAGLKTTNLYAGFIYLAINQLRINGQLIAITPRSFCNGTYFRAFREQLLKKAAFSHIHIYNSRNQAFKDSDVLQENIIYKLKRGPGNQNNVTITASDAPGQMGTTMIKVPHSHVIHPEDPNHVIHVIADELARHTIEKISSLGATIEDLGISVSTGKVVNFRMKEHIVDPQKEGSAPLLYPNHFNGGEIIWPKELTKKQEAIYANEKTEKSLIGSGHYVLVKRFTAKEEPRRVVSVVLSPDVLPGRKVGLENHLNYFHSDGESLDRHLAWGLSTYLNSKLVDMYFRIFNGHTQINATDLRSLRYPTADELREIGKKVQNDLFENGSIDQYLETKIISKKTNINPVEASKQIETTIKILKKLGLPKAQQNERSALTLLALLDIGPEDKWSDATAPMLGITEMMNYFEKKYGKSYAPNTRETVRRQTIHQFVQAGIVIPNPDEPERPPNSPNYVYQIEPKTLGLLQNYHDEGWKDQLKEFLAKLPGLRDQYAAKRKKRRLPIKINSQKKITISAGGPNKLVKKIIDDFCAIFTPGGELLYIGDAGAKMGFFEEEKLKKLGVDIAGKHSKMPDVIVHYIEEDWIVIIEAVTSHGPIDPKRKIELEALFKDSNIGIVYVTAFLTKKVMRKYVKEIAWETEVWVAENPTHMIHFNGERFLGPYDL